MSLTSPARSSRRSEARFATLSCAAIAIGVLPVWEGAIAQELTADRLFPPAASATAESTITIEGKLPQWPLSVWCDRADITIRAAEESGKLIVQVAAEAPPGVAWLRLHDDKSASALLPLLIETAPVTVATEPNDLLTEATRVELPAAIVGKLEKGGDIDSFSVAVPAGQRLVVSVMANRILGSPMDAVLQLTDLAGNVLAQTDDTRGLDPQLSFTSATDGQYLIRLFAFPKDTNSTIGYAGGANYLYRIHATTGPQLDYVLPLLVSAERAAGGNGEADAATLRPFGGNLADNTPVRILPPTSVSPPIAVAPPALGWFPLTLAPPAAAIAWVDLAAEDAAAPPSLPAVVSGHIEQPTTVKKISLPLEPGEKYRARGFSRASGLSVDSVIAVVDPTGGAELVRNDDTGADRDAKADFNLPAAAKEPAFVELQLSDLVGGHGYGHGFSLLIGPIEPSLRMTVAADRFRVVAGDKVEIPVSIQRLDGANQPLRVVAEGLPAGATCEAVLSEAKGDSSKEVKLTIQAAGETAGMPLRFQGSFRIVAYPAPAEPAAATSGAPLAIAVRELGDGFSLADPWLTISPP